MADLVLTSLSGQVSLTIERTPKRTSQKVEKRITLKPGEELLDLTDLRKIYSKEIAAAQAAITKRG